MEFKARIVFFLGIVLLSTGVECIPQRGLVETVFDITKYGAKPDGKSESAQGMIRAWNEACRSTDPAKVVVPPGTFKAGEVLFQGPCKAPKPIIIEIQGELVADSDLSVYSSNYWIEIEHVEGVEVTGGGTINGRGEDVYRFGENGEKIKTGPLLPVSLIFQSVNNSALHSLNFVNSKGFHMKVSDCSNMNVYNLNITAPGNSPNTDGIHISGSTNVNVTELVIKTGDDCVSIGDGTNNLLVTKVTCGPGHGISLGSLGKRIGEDDVKGVIVKNCTLIDTTNGARIKTYRASPKLSASNIIFEDLIMKNVSNPVIIDQDYSSKDKIEPSNVKLSDVHFRNIRGTANIKNPFVTLTCSQTFPCDTLELSNINITPMDGANGLVKPNTCLNAKPAVKGLLKLDGECSLL